MLIFQTFCRMCNKNEIETEVLVNKEFMKFVFKGKKIFNEMM